MYKHLLRGSLALFALLAFGWHTEAQILFTEGFENESPFDAADLCSVGNEYTPSDGNWALGPACAVPTNGIPQLVDYDGDIHLQFNNEYGANSEVFNSATMDISGLSEVRISFDARSMGDLEDTGGYVDKFDVYVVMDGTETNVFSRNAHVDGTKKGGDNAVRTQSYSEQFAATGDEMFIRVKVKISGAGAQEQYALAGLSVCVDANDNGTCDCEEPMTWSEDLSNYTVECLNELPTECDGDVTASRGTVACGLAESQEGRTNCSATTPAGVGDDYAFVLFNVDGDEDDDRYFVPTTNGLTLTQFDNGVAIVEGQVEDVDDPTAILNLYVFFDGAVNGADWPSVSGLAPEFAFKHSDDCTLTEDITDAWTLYNLNSGLSFATGQGSLDGTILQLAHLSAFGFQVGEMANTRNCNYGAGGWLSYSGWLNGESIQGGSGDLLVDLNCSEQINNTCGDGESSVTLVYTAYDENCGDVMQAVQVIDREDTTDPTFDSPPADVSVACTEIPLDVPTLTASDNCDDSDATAPTVSFSGETIPYEQTCTGSYKIDRTWIATDCSGNQSTHIQTITVTDNLGPDITGGSLYSTPCDGSGNTTELNAWLDDHAGASATDNCGGTVSWENNFTGLSDGCGATGSALVTFTASDDCGNTSEVSFTFTITDTSAPTLTADASYDIECENYDSNGIYNATASDICGDAEVELVSVSEASGGSCAGSFLHTYKAVDVCGNESATYQQVVNLIDTDAPVITGGLNPTVECDGSGNTVALNAWLNNNGGASATDNCGEITWDNNFDSLSDDCGATGTVTVTFTATDECENSSNVMLTFTIEDTVEPSIDDEAGDETVECDGMGNTEAFFGWLADHGGATASDDCSEILWTNDYGSYQAAATGFTGSYDAEMWEIIEDGLSTSVEFSEDGSEIHMEGPFDVGFLSGAGVVKACKLARERLSVTFDWDYDLGTYFPNTGASFDPAFYLNDTKYDLTEPDFWGNEDQSGSLTIIVEQGDVFGWGVESYILGGFGDAELTISNFTAQVLPSQDACQEEVRVVTFKASDDCGNYSLTTASFTIQDTTAPSIDTASGDEDVECDGSGNTADLNAWLDSHGGAEASDICGNVTWTNNFTALSDDCGATGSATVTFTATDDCGNANETTATFTIEDTTAPTWDDYSSYVFAACEDILDPTDPTQVPITASEACGTVTYSVEAHQLSGGCPGTWMRIWTATDECTNTSETAEQYVQLYDNVKPVLEITCPSDYTVDADGSCYADTDPSFAGEATVTVSDNCTAEEDILIDITPVDGEVVETCEGAFYFTRTWTATATDACDNEEVVTCEQLITVEDNTNPVISGGEDGLAECDGSGNQTELNAWLDNNGGATATDNCSEITWTNNYTECDGGLGMFTTYRQGDWGSSNDANPAAGMLNSDFATVFPDGVSVGCASGYELNFTSADAIDIYLPCNGGAEDLVLTHGGADPTEEAVDPTCWNNALVSHLLTAKLNVAFDSADADFSDSDVSLGSLVFQEGAFYGLSVSEVIAISDEVLGDCRNDYSPQQCRIALRAFNKNYDEGTDNRGYMQIAGCFTDDCAATGQAIVTFTATDDCDNSDSITLTFTIEDTTAPTISGDLATTVSCSDWSCDADALEALGLFSVTEDCGDYTLEVSCLAGSAGCVQPIPAYTITVTATDECGNESEEFSQILTLVDDVEPTIDTEASNETVECDGSGNTVALNAWLDSHGGAEASDACSDVHWSNDFTSLSNDCGATGSATVTFTAEDDCGNMSTTSAIFTIEDTTAPSMDTEASNETVECDGSGNTVALNDWLADHGGAEASDACSNVTWSYSPDPATVSDACGATGSVTVTFTASDDCNKTTTTTATFTIEDTVEPSIDDEAGDETVECDGMGNTEAFFGWLADHGGATASDDCSEILWTNDYGSYQAAATGFTGSYDAEMWEIIEDGLSTSVEFSEDGSEIHMEGPFDVGFLSGAGVVKACKLARERLSVTFDWDYDLGTYFPNTGASFDPAFYLNDTKYDLTEPDFWGNEDQSGSLTIIVEQGDVFGWGVESYILGGFGDAELTISNFTAQVLPSQDACQEEVRVVTFKASDDCGNYSLTTASFTIQDTTAPSIDTASGDEDVECDGSGNTADLNAWLDSHGGAEASDICGNVTWTNNFTALSDECSATGSATVTFTATDDCGNANETTATFTIEDTMAPDFTGSSAEYSIACDAYSDDTQYEVMASDDCDNGAVITILSNDEVSGVSCAGGILRTYRSEDACGNVSTFEQTIKLTDVDPPSFDITCPENVNLFAGADCNVNTGVDATGSATYSNVTDNCDNDVDMDVSFSDETTTTCPSTYTITRTWTVTGTDHCENPTVETCVQTITVTDQTAPTIEGGSNGLVECDGSGNTSDLNDWLDSNGGATATDNCSDVSWSNNFSLISDACGATGTVDVTFTATDECENSDSITLTFTIQDTTDPSASADAETEVACDEYDPTVAYGNFTAGDACSDVTVVISDLAGSGACAGSYSRTYTVTDDCGNETLVYQVINLTDEDAPSFDITCPENVDLFADADCDADTSVGTNGSATYSNVTDNCDDDVEMEVTSSDETAYGCQGSYTISRTWTVTGTDHCGNPTVKTCVQTITVTDQTAPTISGGANDLVECDGSGNTADLNDWLDSNGGATATDNCSAVSWSNNYSTLSDACGATGTVDVIFTATDECENSDSITLTFTIQDTTQPSLSIEGPANQNLDQNTTCNVDTSVEALGNVSASADDACGSASIEITHVDGEVSQTCTGDDATLEGSYTFVRTFTVTATDECGLQTTDTYEQTITVTDGTAPQFTETCGLDNGDVQDVCCEDLSGTVTIPDACETDASDNCDSDVAIAYEETYVGEYAPTDAVMSFCLSTTPAAYADGEACNGLDPHAFSLFNFDGESRVDFTSVGSGLVSQMNDGTWMLQQELVNEAGTGMLTLTVTYGAASSWDDWFTPGQTNYKRDCGVLVDDHENWDYRIMESGSITGSGDYAGLDLSLSHAPANEYYAFQIGLGANNQNDNYGYSGWIMATGTYGDDAVFFSGDLFGDLDCCLPWSIDREYTASDDCGNATDFAYSISVNGDDCGDDDGALVSGGQGEDHTPGIIGGAGDVLTGKSPIRVTNLQPNPTNDLSLLGFTVTQNMRLRVDMYTMEGILVSELYDGVASPNVNHTLDIEADALQSGMYQIRLSSSQYLVVKKLLVTD